MDLLVRCFMQLVASSNDRGHVYSERLGTDVDNNPIMYALRMRLKQAGHPGYQS